ncbi:MAG: helix-turn-helix domain-containing protein [Euryarchaeota archaeon]|nr:helix-turn-helix domain-containing protein [Euryarchaeota archaeon]
MDPREELSRRIAGEIVLSSSPSATIRKWREVFGVSQRELSEAMGVSTSVISDYESGRRRSPGAAVIRRMVEALLSLDEARGGKVTRAYERMLGRELRTEAILDIREFAEPMHAEELVEIVKGRVVASSDSMQKYLYGYTVIDSHRAILELSAHEFLKIYGLTTERALIFTGVSAGRSPFVAIRVSTIKPGMVVLHGLNEVDSLGIKIAEIERIPVAVSMCRDRDELIRNLRRKTR